MERKQFIKNLLGLSLMSLGGIKTLELLAQSNQMEKNHHSKEVFATFGAIHINNTSLEKAISFWTNIAGMSLRQRTDKMAAFGTAEKTLVVVHQSAQTGFAKGYSGMYHFAIHAASKAEFAKMLYRILANNYPCSPTDHTMTQSVYLDDPDGINIEFALETPERFKKILTHKGLQMETADGQIRSAAAPLEVEEVLKHLPDKNLQTSLSEETQIGHIHLYAQSVEASEHFYTRLGFERFNYLSEYMYADMSAGGNYHHRIAMNAWHGKNKPLAPSESAGLRYYQLIFDTQERLLQGLKNMDADSYPYQKKEGGYWINDPTGNLILLTYA
jgi:catechol 2,3-dioxygenase